MAYTKPAVALLLSAASARVGIASQQNVNAQFPDMVGALFTNCATVTLGTDSTTGITFAAATNNALKCVACIRNGMVWCSRKYLFEFTTAPTSAVVITSNLFVPNPPVVTANQDLGQCCGTLAQTADYQSLPGASAANLKAYNNMTCFVRFTSNVGAANKKAISADPDSTQPVENVATGANWWCSSGRNNQNANATVVNSILPLNVAGGNTNANGNGDPRIDLMIMNCRQKIAMCGGTSALIADIATVGGTAVTRTVDKASMDNVSKCTWIHQSEKGAPTFKAEAGTTSVNLNTKYDLHYAEYNTGSYNQPAKNTIINFTGGNTNPIVVPNAVWTTLKARMYGTTNQKGKIELPSVWMWVDQAAASGAAGYMQKRWFPVQMAADQIALQKSRNTAYTGLLGTYNTARSTYDAAVKPSTTKPDFFASIFNPPKKTVIPLRPAPPTQPADYAGPYQAPFPSTSTSYTSPASQQTTTTVAANQFVVDGEYGGWGAFTMGFLPATSMPIQKSFGVFGWAVDSGTYKAESFSFVQDWKHMCIATAQSGTNGFCPTSTPAVTGNGSVKQILVVSVWANDTTAPAWSATSGGSSLKLTFSLSNWAQNAAAWAKPTRPAAAVAPATPAGAKALAASAAAAAAVAAALY